LPATPLNPAQLKFQQRLLHHFVHNPTVGQDKLFYAFTRFIYSQKPRCALLIKGYAGTGKTSCVSAMVNTLKDAGRNVMLLAPTGRAAKVLGNYSQHQAWTIHKQIYTRQMDSTGHSWFELKENELENTVFFVDEASMIGSEKFSGLKGDIGTGDLLEDLITHVYSGEGCRLVLIGDTAQLPPVGSSQSPALVLDQLRSRYYLNIAELELSEVIRQAEGSGILANATAIRKLITSSLAELPLVKTQEYADIEIVQGDVQPAVEDAYNKYGKEETIILTRSNKRANLYNQQVRARILYHEEEINSSDRMMVLKNNYFWLTDNAGNGEAPGTKKNTTAGFIANGDVIQIVRVRRWEERGAFRFCRATIGMVDYPDLPDFDVLLLCNSIWDESASLSQDKLNELANIIAQDYQHITNKGLLRRAVYQDEYYNALQVKFAYAITCHKAQGGQWPCVFVDQGYISDEMVGLELNRWFYTAFTRAQEHLYLVGFEEKLIGD
jgi:exodeoxyribonuclease-5